MQEGEECAVILEYNANLDDFSLISYASYNACLDNSNLTPSETRSLAYLSACDDNQYLRNLPESTFLLSEAMITTNPHLPRKDCHTKRSSNEEIQTSHNEGKASCHGLTSKI